MESLYCRPSMKMEAFAPPRMFDMPRITGRLAPPKGVP